MTIKLTVTSGSPSGSEPWRLERISRVSAVIAKEFGAKNEKLIIDELHDHKGELTVTWKEDPTIVQKDIVESTWEKEDELKENVIHNICN